VNCFEHVKDMPGIDIENAVAAGASYGGYMMNWIQGQEFGRKVRSQLTKSSFFLRYSLVRPM
jgi:hypothetical protein